MGRTFRETDKFTKIVGKLDGHDFERVQKLVQKIIANAIAVLWWSLRHTNEGWPSTLSAGRFVPSLRRRFDGTGAINPCAYDSVG